MVKQETTAFPERLFVLLGMCIWVGALAFKAWSIHRLSFHWDEFWFLAQVRIAAQGELPGIFQGLHTLVFSWVPAMGTEVEQLRWARAVAWGCLVISSVLLYQLSRRWVPASAALAAPVAFLSCWPTMAHAASFRTDSLILPLVMGVLLLLSGRSKSFAALLGAGVMWGAAVLFTVKSIFLAPVALAMLLSQGWPGPKKALRWVGCVGVGVLLSVGVLVGVMEIAFVYAPENAGLGTLERAATKMFEAWFPQWQVFQWVVFQDPLVWALVAVGALAAWSSRRHLVGLLFSVLPVVFYRNAFDYYYMVMMAPLMFLVAFAIHGVQSRPWKGKLHFWGLLLVMLGFYSGAAYNAARLQPAFKQEEQQAVLEQIHRSFPVGTRYLDHSGTLLGFEKVNGFFSSLGLENYHDSGKSFMPELMKEKPVPLLFSDRETLAPDGMFHNRLLKDDQRWIAASYVHYWGPVWVLGASLPKSPGQVYLAWPGKYRLHGDGPVWLAGQKVDPGQVFEKTSPGHVPISVHWGKEREALFWSGPMFRALRRSVLLRRFSCCPVEVVPVA